MEVVYNCILYGIVKHFMIIEDGRSALPAIVRTIRVLTSVRVIWLAVISSTMAERYLLSGTIDAIISRDAVFRHSVHKCNKQKIGNDFLRFYFVLCY